MIKGFLAIAIGLSMMVACSPPPPSIPSLSPVTAMQLLRDDSKAKGWLTYVQKQTTTCDYSLDLPDQSSHPSTIDLDHIVKCGNAQSPKALDASVSFEYDRATQQWKVSRFSD